MSSEDSSTEHTNQRASDEELFAILRKAKKEKGVPALVTSQFNDLSEYDYTTQGLNDRLENLHEDGIIGHQKAGNRHMWWHSGEGTTDPVELSSLEDLIDYDQLDPERFTEEQAIEIAEAAIPGFKKNWWQRVYQSGDGIFRLGVIVFLITLGFSVTDTSVIPDTLLGFTLLLGLGLILIAFINYAVGFAGNLLTTRTELSEEPWGGRNLIEYVLDQFSANEA